MKAKILLIEDNREISENIKEYLELENYSITQVFDGEKGIEKATKEEYDLIILDLMLPGVDGISIARRVMQKNPAPIIITSARETLQDRLSGFGVGAVDYLVKPFDLAELLARIKVHLGKKQDFGEVPDHPEIFSVCDVQIDMKKHKFLKNGEEVHLTHKEYLIVEKLVESRERVVDRLEIIEYLWGDGSMFDGDNKLDVYISNIRSKLGKDIIITIKGVGYRLGDCL